jgi:hypothetical protein
VTAPVIEVPVIEMKLVVEPEGLVTEACGVVMVSPAFAGAARSSAASEVVARSEGVKSEVVRREVAEVRAREKGARGLEERDAKLRKKNIGTRGPLFRAMMKR